MIIFPAVDIKDGKAVRLKQGDFSQVKVYYDSPVEAAKRWVNEGTNVLHVVDLDGAKEGKLVNKSQIKDIVALGVKVQLGGGLRTFDGIKEAFDLGIHRVVLGTALIKDNTLAKQACDRFGAERIVAGVDLKDGEVAIEGWQEGAQISYETLLKQLQNLDIVNLIVTDINKDGMQGGPNFRLIKEIVSLKLVRSRESGVSRAGSPDFASVLRHSLSRRREAMPDKPNTPNSRSTVNPAQLTLSGTGRQPRPINIKRGKRSTKFNVIASGGVTTLADIRKLTEIGLSGAIIGTAFYEGNFSLQQALESSNVS